MHTTIDPSQVLERLVSDQKDPPATLTEVELYRYKYLYQCLITLRLQRDNLMRELQANEKDAGKVASELSTFQDELSKKYNRDMSHHVITDAGEFIHREQLVRRG